jgi:FkbM family methyltransferase
MRISWRKRISRTIRGRLRARLLSNYGEGIVANSKNGLLVVDPRDFGISRSLLRHGSYDWPEIEWLGRILDERSRIVFAGAHIGALLVPIALRCRSQHIVAFEPSPRNHRLLEMNLALNGLGHVATQRMALGDTEGTVRFTENSINSGNSRVSQSGGVEVAVTRLDAAALPDSNIDLLVMDTEGFEVRAIRGGLETLARTRYFYVEFAPEQLTEQGSEPHELIELVAGVFESMYLPGEEVRFFTGKRFVSYLEGLRPERGLLLNLMFSNEATPRPALMKTDR